MDPYEISSSFLAINSLTYSIILLDIIFSSRSKSCKICPTVSKYFISIVYTMGYNELSQPIGMLLDSNDCNAKLKFYPKYQKVTFNF